MTKRLPLRRLLCGTLFLHSLWGCSPPPPVETPEVDLTLHNDQEIDRYLQQLLDSEDRRMTGFTEAARWGRIQVIQEMLDSGVNVDAQDEFGRTALTLAASGGQLEIIELLISHGADVNFQATENGFTPLIALLNSLHPERIYSLGVQVLLDAGASLSLKDQDGRDAIDWIRIRIKEERLRPDFLNELEAKINSSSKEVPENDRSTVIE